MHGEGRLQIFDRRLERYTTESRINDEILGSRGNMRFLSQDRSCSYVSSDNDLKKTSNLFRKSLERENDPNDPVMSIQIQRDDLPAFFLKFVVGNYSSIK